VLGQLTMLSEDAPAPTARPLRPYQEAAVTAICERLAVEQSTMCVLATGLGKTRIAAEVCQRIPGRKLFLAHMETLVDQAHASLELDTSERWEIEQASFKAHVNSSNNVVASVQSLAQLHRLHRFTRDAFSLIIFDEAHHSVSKFFRTPLEYFHTAKRLAITATPDRKDKRGYLGLYDSVAFRMDLAAAIDSVWSTPLEIRTYESNVNLDGVAWSKGDFVASALDEEIAKSTAPIVKAALEFAGDLKTVIFTPGVASARVVAQALRDAGKTAEHIDGSMERDEKRRLIRAFKANEHQFFVNCLILTEGFDDETIRCLIDAAPTSSRARCEQKLGRGTRLYPGVGKHFDETERRQALADSPKPVVRVIDLAFNSKHELTGPIDVLGGAYDAKERKRAKKILEGGKISDPSAALKKARDEITKRALRAQAARDAKVELKETSAPSAPLGPGEHAISPGQQRLLESWGIDTTGLTKAAAQKIIGKEKLCQRFNWCGHNRRLKLQRAGVPEAMTWAMKVTTGEAIWNAWHANGKKPLTASEIASVIKKQ
jgi:superfamily II DNA or RNA helicase